MTLWNAAAEGDAVGVKLPYFRPVTGSQSALSRREAGLAESNMIVNGSDPDFPVRPSPIGEGRPGKAGVNSFGGRSEVSATLTLEKRYHVAHQDDALEVKLHRLNEGWRMRSEEVRAVHRQRGRRQVDGLARAGRSGAHLHTDDRETYHPGKLWCW